MEETLINFLLNNCVGYENRKKAFELMPIVNLNDHKTFRNLIEDIRQADNDVFICSEAGQGGGYWIPTESCEIEDTITHLRKRAYEMLRTAESLRKKSVKYKAKNMLDEEEYL